VRLALPIDEHNVPAIFSRKHEPNCVYALQISRHKKSLPLNALRSMITSIPFNSLGPLAFMPLNLNWKSGLNIDFAPEATTAIAGPIYGKTRAVLIELGRLELNQFVRMVHEFDFYIADGSNSKSKKKQKNNKKQQQQLLQHGDTVSVNFY
jgi:hypothetical protein